MYLRKLKKTVITNTHGYYEINIPSQGSSYSNNQLCTFSLPPPQLGHFYTYLFHAYNIEQSSISQCQCLDSLLYEHTEDGMPSKKMLSCGDKFDTRLDGKVSTSSNITITFRSNEAVTKSGASFFIYEYLPTVCS